MTTATDNHIGNFELPAVIRVNVGVIELPTRITPDTLSEYEAVNREITHLLDLLPEEDKAEAEFDDNEMFIIHTTSLPALIYATNNYFIDDCLTTCHAVHELIDNQFQGEVCCDCIDKYIDQALDAEYSSVVLESGVYLKRGTF